MYVIKYADSYTIHDVHNRDEALQCKSLGALNNRLPKFIYLELATDNKNDIQHAVMKLD